MDSITAPGVAKAGGKMEAITFAAMISGNGVIAASPRRSQGLGGRGLGEKEKTGSLGTSAKALCEWTAYVP